jgi:hypothetical protein
LECQQVSNSAAAVQGSSISTPEQQIATSQVLPAEQQRPAGHVATAALGAVEDGANPTFQLLQPLAETQQSIPGASTIEDTNAAQQADVAVPVNTELQIHQQCGAEPGRSKPGSSSSASADGFRLAHTSSERRNCSDSSDEETALLLSSGSNNSSSSSSTVQLSPATDVSACSSSWRGRWQAAKGWWAQANEPEQRRATLRLLMYGSLAGSVSGAMAGMTGGRNGWAAAVAAATVASDKATSASSCRSATASQHGMIVSAPLFSVLLVVSCDAHSIRYQQLWMRANVHGCASGISALRYYSWLSACGC